MNQPFRPKPGEPLPEAYVKAAMGEDVLLPGEFLVPHEYVAETAQRIEGLLRAANFTKGVSVAMNTDEPKVATTLARKIGGCYTLVTDLAAAWVDKMDPLDVARQHVRRLLAEVEAGKLRN
jgi:hypothetical protein